MPSSKLFWNAELKQLEVEVTNSKKVTKRWTFPNDQIAPNVPRTISESDEIEVDFDRDPQGNILRVRLKGEIWQGQTTQETIDYQGIKNKAIEDAKFAKSPYKKSYPKTPKEKSKEENLAMSNYFHNPYNFIPAISRNRVTGELGDKSPCGHDRFISDKFSGKLTVKMTVETPLVVLDTARMIYEKDDKNKDKHKKYPVRIGEDGKPYINPTAIKGMLRSAYEAVTNSRMSVFTKHEERLAFRAEVNEGLFVVPARIEDEKVFLYMGTSKPQNNGKPQDGQPMYAAWIRKHQWHGSYSNGYLKTNHKQKVWAYINLWEHKRFDFWNVVEIRPHSATPPTSTPPENRITSQPNRDRNGQNKTHRWNGVSISRNPNGQWVEGYYCETNYNIKNKHDERVFFVPQGQNPIEAVVKDFEQLKKEWKRLVENYQEEHSDGKGGLEKPPNDDLHWSRHISGGKPETKLETDTLCYAKVKKDSSGKFEVLELYPVMISRRLHEVSPNSLLDDSLKPAFDIEKLSPADRVFGCVIKNNSGEKKVNAYRGQIRFSEVECKTEKIEDVIQEFNDNLPMNILGQPKPQQGRFYVGDKDGNAQERGLNNENAGYKKGKNLRGRKVYPHHNLPDSYWIKEENWKAKENDGDLTQDGLVKDGKTYFREYLRPKSEKRFDNQNRSIKGWVKPKTEFQFDIHFTNLSKVELGALVWLLQLNDGLEKPKFFHRFGGGKPLGFGSVKLEIENEEITSGEDLKTFYESLDSTPNKSISSADCKAAFLNVANQDILKTFEVACKGFGDNLPIHYPRARRYKEVWNNDVKEKKWLNSQGNITSDKPIIIPPHSEGLAYEWFVENNRTSNSDNSETRLTLPNLLNETGLPIFDHKKTGG